MERTCPDIKEVFRVDTPQGIIELLGPVSSQVLKQFTFHKSLNNLRPADRQKEALINIAKIPKGIIYTAVHSNQIVGYVSFHPPNKYCRWHKHPHVLEMGTIEVAPDWRKFNIAAKLLQKTFKNPIFEEYIIITLEMYRHWDLRQTHLTVWQYQKMLTKLLGTVNLQKIPTDDPCILEHSANVMMVRYGKNITADDIRLFQDLQFEQKQNCF